jgi:hypothetical protein
VRGTRRPPLLTRLQPADFIALDAIAAAAYLGLLAGWVLPRVPRLPSGDGVGVPGLPGWLDWFVVLIAVAPIVARRRYPLTALGMAACGTVLLAVGGLRQAPFPALAYVLYWLALTRPRRSAAVALAVALAAVVAAYAASTSPTALSPAGSGAAVPSLIFTGLAQVAAWLIGRTVRQQRAYAHGLAEILTHAPGLGELPRLVARSATAGLTVTVDAEGVPPDLPAVIEVTAYRVIQEALTNVIRHSGADRCHVALGYGASQLSIEVTNPAIGPRVPLADPATVGHGLIGMRERVIMLDGKFSARPTASGGFAVIATMPLAEVPT